MQNIKYPFTVELAGDSIWDYDGPAEVTVSNISVSYMNEDWDPVEAGTPGACVGHVAVAHDTTWEIYTDSGFEKAISEKLGFEVSFTEQGMQDNFMASME
tara:strand:+ start:274 stop:573 length:300 start_codon:yes stop_codon:yes gene_type:complete